MGKFNDFSALIALKKDLGKKETPGEEGGPQQKRRNRTVAGK